MTTERETLRIIGSWMEEDGRTRLPDHVLDAVLDQLPATPQRRPGWTARRITHVNGYAKYAIAAAAVVVIAIAGFNLLGSPGSGQVGAPPSAVPSSPPTTEPSPSVVPIVPTSGAIEPGRYRWAASGGEVSVVIPDGWTGRPDSMIAKNADTPADITFGHNLPGTTYEVTHVYADACASEGRLEPVGPTVDDLVAALDAQESTDVLVGQITAGSVVGQRVEMRQPADLADRSACRYGLANGPLQIWADELETGFFALAPDFSGVAYIFDVDGERVVFNAVYGPEATEADVEAVDAIVQSMEFTPAAP